LKLYNILKKEDKKKEDYENLSEGGFLSQQKKNNSLKSVKTSTDSTPTKKILMNKQHNHILIKQRNIRGKKTLENTDLKRIEDQVYYYNDNF
jgi:hypothetical protein